MKFPNIFVTTGTTQFAELIETFLNSDIIDTLYSLGCTKLTIQYGQYKDADTLNLLTMIPQIKVIMFGYRDSIDENIDDADLVIGHAGAGTTLEVLRKHKPLIVVVNDKLMDNHQQELAEELEENNFVIATSPSMLNTKLESISMQTMAKFPDKNPKLFGEFVQKIMKNIK